METILGCVDSVCRCSFHAFVSFFGFASDLDWTLGSQHSTVNINVLKIKHWSQATDEFINSDINSSSDFSPFYTTLPVGC